jgi:hypothetical protein
VITCHFKTELENTVFPQVFQDFVHVWGSKAVRMQLKSMQPSRKPLQMSNFLGLMTKILAILEKMVAEIL